MEFDTPPHPGRRALLLLAGGGVAGLATPRLARAQQPWPSQPVRFIGIYAPGGATDIASRAWCHAMGAVTGQSFVVENRTGAGGTVGTDAIAKARPDGYTIGLGSVAGLAIAPSLFPSLPYDAERDFTYVSMIWRQPNLVMVNNDVPARSVPELIELLKRNPGKYHYAIGGAGTTPHLTAEMFKTMTGVDMPAISYRGGAPALIDVIAGRVPILFDNFSGPIGAVREGKLRGLAVSSPQRSPAAPDLPALAEFLPGFDITSWNGAAGPAGIPPEIVAQMSAASKRALESPELKRVYAENGATPWWLSPEDFRTYRLAQAEVMGKLVKASGAKPE
jgi:tripartite-type tricarboxylate transporter receptor subunit TctC